MIKPDGIQAAAKREVESHPTSPTGITITAWQRRANTLEALVAEVNRLTASNAQLAAQLDVIEGAIASRPF